MRKTNIFLYVIISLVIQSVLLTPGCGPEDQNSKRKKIPTRSGKLQAQAARNNQAVNPYITLPGAQRAGGRQSPSTISPPGSKRSDLLSPPTANYQKTPMEVVSDNNNFQRRLEVQTLGPSDDGVISYAEVTSKNYTYTLESLVIHLSRATSATTNPPQIFAAFQVQNITARNAQRQAPPTVTVTDAALNQPSLKNQISFLTHAPLEFQVAKPGLAQEPFSMSQLYSLTGSFETAQSSQRRDSSSPSTRNNDYQVQYALLQDEEDPPNLFSFLSQWLAAAPSNSVPVQEQKGGFYNLLSSADTNTSFSQLKVSFRKVQQQDNNQNNQYLVITAYMILKDQPEWVRNTFFIYSVKERTPSVTPAAQ